MTKIAMLTGSLQKGGSERVLTNLATYLISQGWQVTMVTTYVRENEYPLPEGAERVISDITAEETTGNRASNFIRRYRKLQNIWEEQKPDIILSFIGKNNIMALATARKYHIPVVVSVRGEPNEEYYSSIMRLLAKNLFKQAAGVVLQTSDCMKFFPEKVQKKAVILKNPVNQEFFIKPYVGERDKTIVAVGRIDENKNHRMLMEAFRQIAQEFPEYKLIIYGEGELRQELIKEAASWNMEERILLPGSVENVAETIKKTRVFVLCSNTEGVPNTLIEAMILGLSVISTDCPCGGPKDLIDSGVNGILTPVGDVEQMKENLQKALKNLQYVDSMGLMAQKTADIYQPGLVLDTWREYLKSMIK